MHGWTATARYGVTRKRSTKRLKHTGSHFRKNVQFKVVCWLWTKVSSLRPATLLKKRFRHRSSPVNFMGFLLTFLLVEHLRWLLLYKVYSPQWEGGLENFSGWLSRTILNCFFVCLFCIFSIFLFACRFDWLTFH